MMNCCGKVTIKKYYENGRENKVYVLDITKIKRRKTVKKYNVKILTGNDSITIIDAALKTFRITCKNEEHMYSAKKIKAVVIKTMDTGPDVEDMYAEIHTDDAIYIILSESPLFKDTILDKLNSIIPINLESFVEASECHLNKTFVLYQKEYLNVKIKDKNKKRAAIIDEIILQLVEEKQENLREFLFAMLSFCPMYLIFVDNILKIMRYLEVSLYFTGNCMEGEVSDPLCDESGIPVLGFTSYDKRLLAKEFEIRNLSAKKYITFLVETEQDLLLNFDPNANLHIRISSRQLKEKVLPLIMRREDSVCKKRILNKTIKKKKGFLGKLFRR